MKASELKIYLDILVKLDPDANVVVSTGRDGQASHHEIKKAEIDVSNNQQECTEYSLTLY